MTPVETAPLSHPDPNLTHATPWNVIWSEVGGGIHLGDLSAGTVLEVQTDSHLYNLVILSDVEAWISGHSDYCPEPVLVRIYGSTWGGSMLWAGFIGRGMFMEFGRPDSSPVTTSRIIDVRKKS